ncbi:hypothetical protein ACFWW5_21080 [Streptomyces albidoflavus]|uniref:hypothetical protein n=1 Tax=Streptomyces albidoflavus TaxID=1886 RepID=UPI0033CE5B28
MVNVGSSLSTTDAEEDDGWGDEDAFINDLVKRGPYNAEPIDKATLPVDRKERLKAVEAALMQAEATRSKSVAWSKLRWTVETGVALRLLIEEDLYKEDPEFTSLETYADNRLHLSRGHVYELVDDAARLLAIAPLSEISDKPFNASQAKVLAPLMEPVAELDSAEAGRTKAELVVADVAATGKKRTAAALRKAAEDRGFTVSDAPAVPSARKGSGKNDGIEDAEIVENDGTRAIEALHGFLKNQQAVYDGIGGGLLSRALQHDTGATEDVLRDLLQYLTRTEHRIRAAMKPAASEAA